MKMFQQTLKLDFDTSNYQLDGSFPKGKNITVIRLIKDKLGVKVMSKLVR